MESVALNRVQSREIDRIAINDYWIPGIVLMENAGRNCAERILSQMNHSPRQTPTLIACGPGNNGGDGLVIARHLHNQGVPVRVLLVCDPDKFQGDAAINFRIVDRMGLTVIRWDQLETKPEQESAVTEIDGQPVAVFVDAMLGSGAQGDPRSPMSNVITFANGSTFLRIAIDIPTGLDCDSGQPGQPTVRAHRTLSLVSLKTGFTQECAAEYLGSTEIVDIGIPTALIGQVTGNG